MSFLILKRNIAFLCLICKDRKSKEYKCKMKMTREEIEQRKKKRKRRRQKAIIARITAGCIVFAMLFVCFLGIRFIVSFFRGDHTEKEEMIDCVATMFEGEHTLKVEKPEWEQKFLTVNEFSRPGEKIGKVKNIFVHYTANAGTSAEQNRSYFESLAQTGEVSASAHFIIGYNGEIIQCVPLEEIAYAVKGRNYDSISIECCYLEESGEFTKETMDSLIPLVSWLMGEYNLEIEDVWRHYDEAGKLCPKYYVENQTAWETVHSRISNYLKENGK